MAQVVTASDLVKILNTLTDKHITVDQVTEVMQANQNSSEYGDGMFIAFTILIIVLILITKAIN